MTNRYPIYLVLVLLAALAAGCNGDDETVTENDYGNVAVTSFKLKPNSNILAYMDSVFFSIDLERGEIYNADSLPAGTDVSRLVVAVGTPTVSASDLTYRLRGTQRDTTISLLRSPKDSINFADGPVKLKITSYDQLNSRTYTIRVNVHKMKPDSLAWDRMAVRRLPSVLDAPQRQKTVQWMGRHLCVTVQDGRASVATCADPYAGDWLTADATLPDRADLSSLTALGPDLYILSGQDLCVSHDCALTWEATGAKMVHILGSNGEAVIGAARYDDGWKSLTYPATRTVALPDGCPVEGTSPMLTTRSQWQSAPTSTITGGATGDGTLTGDTWGYDGEKWARISANGLPPVRGVAVFPYFTFSVDEITWWVSTNTALIALGGELADGTPSRNVYVSHDNGIHWVAADTLMQLPGFIPPFRDAQALVAETTLPAPAASRSGAWRECPAPYLPGWWRVKTPGETKGRATSPEDTWQCPYVYLYGGTDMEGRLHDTVWRGAINRLTFKPLY